MRWENARKAVFVFLAAATDAGDVKSGWISE
jgi:hypothetical protein